MPREGLEVADVFRRFGLAFREQHGASLSGARRRAMRDRPPKDGTALVAYFHRDDNRQKTMTLPGEEFIRRFLIHVLPGGFHRIRYFGFLGNCHRAQKLERCRQLLGMVAPQPAADPPADHRDRSEALTAQSLRECPHCHTGIMVVIDCIPRPKVCVSVPDTS